MLANYNGKKNNNAARCLDVQAVVSSDHRCCAERRLLESWVVAARRHGVPSHKVVPWVRRKLGPTVVVLRFRGDGTLGCSVPCVLCQRELTRFDLRVHCFVGEGAAGGGDANADDGWFRGRLSDAGAPTSVLTAGQRRTLNLDPGTSRLQGASASADATAAAGSGSATQPPSPGRTRRPGSPPPPTGHTAKAGKAGGKGRSHKGRK